MKKCIYALITTNCNLSCPHCDIKNNLDGYNEELFINTLDSLDCEIILFGGEITVHQDRLFDIVNRDNIFNKVTSATTNLIILNDELLSLYKKIGRIATSWNPNRFNENEYNIWKHNLDILEDQDINISILITLTYDLFDIPIDTFLDIVKEWNENSIHGIKFEYLVDEDLTSEYYDIADEWLCKIYEKWDFKFPMINANQINNYYYDCSNKYTLWPNGNLEHGCPHHLKPTIPDECYSCDRAHICKPCQLQHHCSYPKKFADLVNNKKQ